MKTIALLSGAGALLALALSPSGLRWLHGLLASRGPQLPDGVTVDVAVVLGYALFRNGSLTEPLKGRVKAGVEAYLQGRARNLLFSGSHPGGVVVRRTEANVMREYAEGLLLPEQAHDIAGRWFEEDESTSTLENAVFSLAICRRHGWRSLLVVTSPFHQLRSELVFRRLILAAEAEAGAEAETKTASVGDADQGPLKVFMAPAAFAPHAGYSSVPGVDRAVDLWDWVRELLALAYYYVKGRL